MNITISCDRDILKLIVIALRDAESEHVSSIHFGRLVPDVEKRRQIMKMYHEWNGDPESFDEDMENEQASLFLNVNPNWFLGMLYEQCRESLGEEGKQLQNEYFLWREL